VLRVPRVLGVRGVQHQAMCQMCRWCDNNLYHTLRLLWRVPAAVWRHVLLLCYGSILVLAMMML
jgi:hypothetical protein